MKAQELLNQQSPELKAKLLNFRESLRHAEIVKAYGHCGACGEKIAFVHQTNRIAATVTESGICTGCQGAVPARIFRLS